jgi:hypothetical protein
VELLEVGTLHWCYWNIFNGTAGSIRNDPYVRLVNKSEVNKNDGEDDTFERDRSNI